MCGANGLDSSPNTLLGKPLPLLPPLPPPPFIYEAELPKLPPPLLLLLLLLMLEHVLKLLGSEKPELDEEHTENCKLNSSKLVDLLFPVFC